MSEATSELKLDKNRFRVKYCPCEKSNKDGKFVPFVGFDEKGYCHACNQTFIPDLSENKFSIEKSSWNEKSRQIKELSFIPDDVFIKSLDFDKELIKKTESNRFIYFLYKLFGHNTTYELLMNYLVGSSNYWDSATVFWQFDTNNRLRTGKIIQYEIIESNNSFIGIDCKRVKNNKPPVYWVHSQLKLGNYKQCLFGEHLIKENLKKPIAIVESEKSAIIASAYLPEYIWVAVGSISNLNIEKCQVLTARNVTLFPDLNGYELWSNKANELSDFLKISVSRVLHNKTTADEKSKGYDIADYLILHDYRAFK